MSAADPKVLAAAKSYLERQKLEFEEVEEQYGTRLQVRAGAQKVPLTVYNTGRVVVGGATCPLKQSLEQLRDALMNGEALPGQPLPFEIEKFPTMIMERVPNCDPVIVKFIDEAIRCVKADSLLAGAFMLGAASERAVNGMIEDFQAAIKDDTSRARFQGKVSKASISKRWDEFMSYFKSSKNKPTEAPLNHDLEIILGSMFQFCRITRNDVGHPQIVPDLDKGVLLANLAHFSTYIERIYLLRKHFADNGVDL